MSASVLAINNDFPIRTHEPVHSGKVRSVYWLTAEDSARLINQRGYPVPGGTPLAILIVSDRLSAFDCIWRGQHGLQGVPGKGAVLNAVSGHWFNAFAKKGLARSHILEAPHPLVWIVQRARPIRIEAIARQYITGSMWRDYSGGQREFGGVLLPDNLSANQRLPQLLITPSSKGVLRGLAGIAEADDVNISRRDIERHWSALGFDRPDDVDRYEQLLRDGFDVIAEQMALINQLFVDTKFEFGYAMNENGENELIYMDEVGTPDSSRIWDGPAYAGGQVVENSKEGFRQDLLQWVPDRDLLLNKDRMDERLAFAASTELPEAFLMAVSDTYRAIGETITGQPVGVTGHPREEIIDLLSHELDLI